MKNIRSNNIKTWQAAKEKHEAYRKHVCKVFSDLYKKLLLTIVLKPISSLICD